jgi:hypothetical protein
MSKTSFNAAATAAALALAALAAAPAAQAADLRVAKDPATGQLRAPTADEAKALDAAAATKAPVYRGLLTGRVNPPPIRHPDGTVEQELDESTLQFSVARRNADGTISMDCVTGPEAAAKSMKGGQFANRITQERTRDVK